MFFSWEGNNKHTPQLKGIVSVERLRQVFGRERASSIITCKAMVGEFALYRANISKASLYMGTTIIPQIVPALK